MVEVQIEHHQDFLPGRLFFVLHLLVNSVIIMAIARKAVEHFFILTQFFPYMRKQG